MTKVHKLILLASTAIASWPVAALAQSSAAAPVESADADLGDIIVTAQKREQSLTDVGISINVRSGDELKDAGVVNTSDLQKVVPALCRPRDCLSSGTAPSRSWTSAGCTGSSSARPSVSTMAWRLRPITFLPASYPRDILAARRLRPSSRSGCRSRLQTARPASAHRGS